MVLKTILLLYLLLTERGWSDSAQDPMQVPPKELDWKFLSSLKKDGLGSAEVRETAIALCWDLGRLCLNTFTGRLSVPSNERGNERQYADAEWICDLLGFDLYSFRAHAVESIPYAKAWREEVEDEWTGEIREAKTCDS